MCKTSYGEKLCRGLLKRWFPDRDAVYNYRPIWLKNPKTDRNLELDIYYPDLRLAVEFNGIQHRLLLQRRKDYFKQQQCLKLGILFLSVYHPLDLYKFKKLVRIHTGVKPPSGRSDEEFLYELRMYTIGEGNAEWYERSKEESEKEEVALSLRKEIRKELKRKNKELLKGL